MNRPELIALFDDYCERYQAQERPDVRAYLAQAGSESGALAALIDQYLLLAPMPPTHPDAIEWLRQTLRRAGY